MSRSNIYYWKSDHPGAFDQTASSRRENDLVLVDQVQRAVMRQLDLSELQLRPAGSQGNHLTWIGEAGGQSLFVRVYDGPSVESHLHIETETIQALPPEVPVPQIFGVDVSREFGDFDWQVMERVPHPDLNHWFKAGLLDRPPVARQIGQAVARWQAVRPRHYGPLGFNLAAVGPGNASGAVGCHEHYRDYFCLKLEEHLSFLVHRGFVSEEQRRDIEAAVEAHAELLDLKAGCLVHKDLALWNVLGPADRVAAFIDFDDAIAGDAMDDLSLLGCFHDASFLASALEGYRSIRALPQDHRRRFWLHMLRNMIVKSVIRVGGGYFERDGGFFLIGAGATGQDFRQFTLDRLFLALRSLREDAELVFL